MSDQHNESKDYSKKIKRLIIIALTIAPNCGKDPSVKKSDKTGYRYGRGGEIARIE